MLISLSMKAQTKMGDTIHLRMIAVKGKFLGQNAINKVSFDSIVLANERESSLSQLLSAHSPVFVKSYGQGSLATVSYRGTGASHTNIMWNDMKLNSPMIGQMDVSLVPVSFFSNIVLIPGSSVFGDAGSAFGGTIILNNEPDWQNSYGLNLSQSMGSFGTFLTNLGIDAGGSILQYGLKAFFSTSKNDFSFINIDKPEAPQEIRKNAGYSNGGFLQELHFKAFKNVIISGYSWNQWNNRDIPEPTVVEPGDERQYQENAFSRNILEAKIAFRNGGVNIRTGYIFDDLKYTNERNKTNSRNTVRTFNFKIRGLYYLLEGLDLNVYLGDYYDEADSDHYTGLKRRNEFISGMGIKYNFKDRFLSTFNLDQKLLDGSASPILPSLSLKFYPFQKVQWYIHANAARNYNFPSLNDLYWGFDGFAQGNPDLNAERGWNIESGVGYKSRKEYLNISLAGFYTVINDHIFWSPISEDAVFWKPDNLKQLISRGLDITLHSGFKIFVLELDLNAGYQYVVSTNEQTSGTEDKSLGKQLIYTPRHQSRIGAFISFYGFVFNANIQYTGKRYTAIDNSRYLPAFWLSDVSLKKRFAVNNSNFAIGLKVNNLFDVNYRIIAKQPMPGSNYLINLSWNISKEKNK